jgi:hypothetical protein
MTITDEEIKAIMNDPNMKAVLEALAKYDSRYIGNVPEKEARKLFPEMFEKKK